MKTEKLEETKPLINLETAPTVFEAGFFRIGKFTFHLNLRNDILGSNQKYSLTVKGNLPATSGHKDGPLFNKFVGYMIDLGFGQYRIEFEGQKYLMQFEESGKLRILVEIKREEK